VKFMNRGELSRGFLTRTLLSSGLIHFPRDSFCAIAGNNSLLYGVVPRREPREGFSYAIYVNLF
jgi:hypothetical protein